MKRWCASRELPARAFVPGAGERAPKCAIGVAHARVAPECWREDEDYLFGVDLWNARCLWEAHEAWEACWRAARDDATQATFLRGLIQCAAAALHVPMAKPRGMESLAARGAAKLARVAEQRPRFMGLDAGAFVREFRAFAVGRPTALDALPVIDLG